MNPASNPVALLAVGVGAMLGAWLRWWLGTRLNAVLPNLPLGTLSANLIGGYVIGLALAAVVDGAAFSPTMRLLIMTGFCGGLTTFSSFSAETVSLLMAGKWLWAAIEVGSHLLGSLGATMAGVISLRLLRGLIS